MEISFWKDKEKGLIDPDLFSGKAEQIAKKIYEEQVESRGKANKPTQVRKFYDEVVSFGGRLQGLPDDKQEEAFNKALPYLKMINAKAAYAMGRDLISKSFKDFISSSLARIQDKNDFEVFAGLFESFMGFYKYYDAKKGDTPNQGGQR